MSELRRRCTLAQPASVGAEGGDAAWSPVITGIALAVGAALAVLAASAAQRGWRDSWEASRTARQRQLNRLGKQAVRSAEGGCPMTPGAP